MGLLLFIKKSKLIRSVRNGKTDDIKALLDQGADVNTKTKSGDTILMIASQNVHTKVVKLLLEMGADVNAKRKDGTTALWRTSDKGHTDVVKLLLDKGADVNAKWKECTTALVRASGKGHTDVVKLLLDKGADVNTKWNYNSSTALYIASQLGNTDIVKLLLDKGADVNVKHNYDGSTALYIASQFGHTDIVKLLLEYGADMNLKTTEGLTALAIASNKKVVKLLTKASPSKSMENVSESVQLGKKYLEGQEVTMNFPEKFTVKYKKLDDFIFPIVKNVCYPRGKDDSTEFFDAFCPKCRIILNSEEIAFSASLMSIGKGVSGCPNCGYSSLVVILKGLSQKDKEQLLKDKFFSKILKSQ